MPPVRTCEPSLRQLNAVRVIAEHGSLSAAARVLNRTQPALTKQLRDTETRLGVPLFDRFSAGVEPTPYCRLLVEKVREAHAQFEAAAREHAAALRSPRQPTNPVFTMQVSRRRLDAFLAVHELRHASLAAAELGMTRAGVYDSLRVLEKLLDLPLFESTGTGLRSTVFGDMLATRVSLALSLIRHGLEEIASADGATRGSLVIGTLPYSRTILVPRAIDRLLAEHPALEIRTREGPYDVLERALRSGTVDVIVGATREHGPDSPLRSESLFEDELAVICGRHHPLASRRTIDIDDMLTFGWVLPARTAPARRLFDAFLVRHAATEPARVVETASLSAARGLLVEGNWLALLSAHQVQLDLDAGLLVTLPVQLEGTFRPIGVTLRAHNTPSPAAREFLNILRDVAPMQNRPMNRISD